MADRLTRTPTTTAVADRATRPRRYNSLVAAAEVMTAPGRVPAVSRAGRKPTEVHDWMKDLWRHYDGDSGGEFRFGVTWVGNGLSRVNLVAARPPLYAGDEPQPINPTDPAGEWTEAELAAHDFVSQFAGGPVGQGQLMNAFGQHLSVTGIGWLVAEPDLADSNAEAYVSWQVLATDNVRVANDGRWEVNDSGAWRPAHPNALIVRCWRRHPLRPWEPDCPARSARVILEQIEMLTLTITGTAQSRLAGAGILAIPSEATFPPSQAVKITPDGQPAEGGDDVDPDPADLFIETFIATTTTPIRDRGSAAAVVPLVIQVPGEHLQKLMHLTFHQQGDPQVIEKLTFAIRRLALALDMPPEVLLGMGDLTHWNAWQIADTAITLHIEPNAEAVCEGITDGWLIPTMTAAGHADAQVMVWYDTSDLSTRPDKSAVTTDAYNLMEASGAALRRELGLDESDAPSADEKRERLLIRALEIAGVQMAPVILAKLGVIEQELADKLLAASLDPGGAAGDGFGDGGALEPVVDEQAPPERPAPELSTDEPALAAALVAASDGIVHRALERAGSRVRSSANRRGTTFAHADSSTLHTIVDALSLADLDNLLAGAWDRVPEVAARYGVDPDALTVTLSKYVAALIASRSEHTIDRLRAALGA